MSAPAHSVEGRHAPRNGIMTGIKRRIRALTARADPARQSAHVPDMRAITHTGGGLTCVCVRCGSPLTLKVNGWQRGGSKRRVECI